MVNRRFGGNQRGGGRSFPQANLNPWQGGVTPGNSLDTNIPAQLALVLNNLLHSQQPNNPPSLLSLNTSPGFMNQDSNYGSQNRFASRGRSDFRRSEPYNKNRGSGWRNERRGGNFSSARSNSRSFKDKKAETEKTKNSDKSSKTDDPKSKSDEPEIIDISMDDLREEDGTDPDKKKGKSNGDESESEKDEKKEGTGEGKKKDKKDNSKYAGLPYGFLHCFVCDKSMWDGESFQNHLRGKAHKQMLASLEDSFQTIVNILRYNMKHIEGKKMIELDRIQRNNRKFVHKFQEPESHCNMCDLKFLGKIMSHRKTKGHQRLKRFLHPNCDICNLEFPSRMEWVDHRFTPEHLHKLKEVLDGKGTPEDGYKIVEDEGEFDIEPLLQENMQTEDKNPVLELSDDLANLQNRIPAYNNTRAISKSSLKSAEGFICEICNSFFASETMSQAHLKSEGHYYSFITAAKNKYKRQATEKAEGDEDECKRKKLDDSTSEPQNENEDIEKDTSNGGNEIYDPEEACNEEENVEEKKDDAKEDGDEKKSEEVETVDNEAKKEGSTEQEVETKEIKQETPDPPAEVEADPGQKSPRKGRGGAVKNGAGPKSKTRGRKAV